MKTLSFRHSKRPQMPTALPKPLTPATQTSQSITVQDHGSVLPREACDDQGGVWLPSTARAGLGSLRDLAQRLCCQNPKPTSCVCNPNQTCWCYLDNVNIQIKQKVLSNNIVIIFELSSSSSSLIFFVLRKSINTDLALRGHGQVGCPAGCDAADAPPPRGSCGVHGFGAAGPTGGCGSYCCPRCHCCCWCWRC